MLSLAWNAIDSCFVVDFIRSIALYALLMCNRTKRGSCMCNRRSDYVYTVRLITCLPNLCLLIRVRFALIDELMWCCLFCCSRFSSASNRTNEHDDFVYTPCVHEVRIHVFVFSNRLVLEPFVYTSTRMYFVYTDTFVYSNRCQVCESPSCIRIILMYSDLVMYSNLLMCSNHSIVYSSLRVHSIIFDRSFNEPNPCVIVFMFKTVQEMTKLLLHDVDW
jgi:hypothetical protein